MITVAASQNRGCNHWDHEACVRECLQLGSSVKRAVLKSTLQSVKADNLLLQKTKLEVVDDAFVCSLKPFCKCGVCVQVIGRTSGGSLVWNSLYWKQLYVFAGDLSVSALLDMRLNMEWVLSVFLWSYYCFLEGYVLG